MLSKRQKLAARKCGCGEINKTIVSLFILPVITAVASVVFVKAQSEAIKYLPLQALMNQQDCDDAGRQTETFCRVKRDARRR